MSDPKVRFGKQEFTAKKSLPESIVDHFNVLLASSQAIRFSEEGSNLVFRKPTSGQTAQSKTRRPFSAPGQSRKADELNFLANNDRVPLVPRLILVPQRGKGAHSEIQTSRPLTAKNNSFRPNSARGFEHKLKQENGGSFGRRKVSFDISEKKLSFHTLSSKEESAAEPSELTEGLIYAGTSAIGINAAPGATYAPSRYTFEKTGRYELLLKLIRQIPHRRSRCRRWREPEPGRARRPGSSARLIKHEQTDGKVHPKAPAADRDRRGAPAGLQPAPPQVRAEDAAQNGQVARPARLRPCLPWPA